MLLLSIGVLCITAILGMVLFSFVLKHQEPPKPIAFLHGMAAIFGFTALVVSAVTLPISKLWVAVGLFVLVELGGLYMITQDLLTHHVRKKIALAHGLTAISTIAFVMYCAYQYYLTA
jgi:hypothetical protein